MKAWIAVFVLAGLVVLAGCEKSVTDSDRAIALAKADVAKEFKDPDSVNFQNIKTVLDTQDVNKVHYVCGEVNAKNGFGAYVGYEKFYGAVEGQGSKLTLKFTALQTESQRRGTWFYPYECNKG